MATTPATAGAAPTPEVVRTYNALIQETNQLAQKIAELEFDKNEHRLVEDTLRPLDGKRRAYRLVGEILVERTVEEVLPSVAGNREKLESTLESLQSHLETKNKELTELKTKYNLQTDQSG